MKKTVHKIAFFALAIFTLASCQKVDELSDVTSVDAVTVVSAKSVATPDAVIVTDTTIIKGDTIIVPLLAGANFFPAVLTFDIVTTGVEQITNLEEGNKLTFDNLTHIRKFYTVAASGATATWFVKVQNMATNEGAEVLRAESVYIAESEALGFAEYCIIDPLKSSVLLPIVNYRQAYPSSANIKFVLSDGSKIISDIAVNEDGSYTFEFNDKNHKNSITVSSQTGNTKEWSIGLKLLSDYTTGSFPVSPYIKSILNIDPSVSIENNSSVEIVRVSTVYETPFPAKGAINITVEESKLRAVQFPVKVKLDFPKVENQSFIWLPKDGIFTFDEYTDIVIYTQEAITGLVKRWNVSLMPKPNTIISDVVFTEITSSKVPNLTMANPIVFDKNALKIVFPITWNGGVISANTDLGVKFGFTYISPDGKLINKSRQSLSNLNSILSVTVPAASGPVSQKWNIYLHDTNAVDKSSVASVSGFSADYYYTPKNEMTLNTNAEVDSDTKTLTLAVNSGVDDMPLTVDLYNIKLSNGMANVKEPQFNSAKEPIVFDNISSKYNFTVVAEDGVTEQVWTVQLANDVTPLGTTANLNSVVIKGVTEGVVVVNSDISDFEKLVTLDIVGDVLPIYISANFVTSDNSYITGLNNNMLLFYTEKEVNTFTITSQDGKTSNEWRVKLKKASREQIPNSGFEKWGKFADVNGGTTTLDPIPGVGYGWATANLMLAGMGVEGTKAVGHLDGFAAQMSTAPQNTIVMGDIIATGTVYSGKFDATDMFEKIPTPWLMTDFGVPFTGEPKSFSFDVKYKAGPQLQVALRRANITDPEPDPSKPLPNFKIFDVDGVDEGHIWIKLLHWPKSEPLKFHGYNYQLEGLTILGETELVIDGSDSAYQAWQNKNIVLNYNPDYTSLEPTHLVVVMASSKNGDKFIGATGSTLTVDNFVINY